MKKFILLLMSIVVSFSLAGAAAAAGYKPPKEICLEVEPGIFYCLATKSLGSIKFQDKQKVQYYSVNGSFYLSPSHYPLGGTAYMDGSLFRFHVSGQYMGMPNSHHTVEGFVDLSAEPAIGQASVITTCPACEVGGFSSPLTAVPCSEVDGPDGILQAPAAPAAPAGSGYIR